MLSLILLLLQAAPAQRSLEDAVAAFAKGEAAARDEILKAGVSAVLPLRKMRKQPSEPIDALLFELKTAAAGFPTKAIVEALDRKRSIEMDKADLWTAGAELGDGLPLVFDPALFRIDHKAEIKLEFKDRSCREILESFCRQAGLDYGFFYDVILIAAPERLWPVREPRRVTPLTSQETEHAVQFVGRLSSDEVKVRNEASAALKALGTGVLPLLEEGTHGGDGEGRARCADLIRQLKAPPIPAAFHAPAVLRQKLAGAEEDLLKRLREEQVSFKVQDIVLDGAMQLMCQPRQIPFRLGPGLKNARVTLDIQNVPTWALISIAAHAHGFDFLLRNGHVIIDTKDEIERQLGQ